MGFTGFYHLNLPQGILAPSVPSLHVHAIDLGQSATQAHALFLRWTLGHHVHHQQRWRVLFFGIELRHWCLMITGIHRKKIWDINPLPIGSMYAIYGNIYHQYTPNVSIYRKKIWDTLW